MRLFEFQPTAKPSKKPAKAPVAKAKVSKAPAAVNLEKSSLGSFLEQSAKSAGIVGAELAAFLAQCKVETMGFTALEELPNNYQKNYEPVIAKDPTGKTVVTNPTAKTLGNVQPGDGERFKGRGYIQLTGRYNYTQFAQESGIPVDKKPELLKDPSMAAKASIWFWQNKVKPVVKNVKNTAAVTKAVNGRKMLGLKQRDAHFKNYMQTLASASQPAKVQGRA